VYGLTLTTTGGGATPPTAPPTTSPTPRPTATPRPPTTPPTTPPAGNAWKAGTAYSFGSIVTYDGVRYINRIPHRAQAGWEPPNVPALWIRL
jgi:chitin-binding protein